MATKITDPKIETDDATVLLIPNSVKFTENFGERKVTVQSAGGGVFENVIADDVSTHIGALKFAMENTVANIATVKKWRAKDGILALTLIGKTVDGALKRTFQQATFTNNPEIALSADGNIECEFMTVNVI